MTMKLKKELYGATRMFTFLKQMKGHHNNMKGRFINILYANHDSNYNDNLSNSEHHPAILDIADHERICDSFLRGGYR